MRLPLQITLGQVFVVLLPIGLAVLGVSMLLELMRNIDQITKENYDAVEAAYALHSAMLRYEIAGLDGSGEARERERRKFEEALEALRTVARDPRESAIVVEIENEARSFFEGETHLEDMADVVSSAVGLQEDAILKSGARCLRTGRSGIGLTVVLGGLALLLALYFGYWLTRHFGHPMEQALRGIEELIGGNLQRRLPETSQLPILQRQARGVNLLADRLQRAESAARLEYLLVAAATVRLLDERERPAVVLDRDGRLVVANTRARQLSDEELGALLSRGPGGVERVLLTEGEGRALGEIVLG